MDQKEQGHTHILMDRPTRLTHMVQPKQREAQVADRPEKEMDQHIHTAGGHTHVDLPEQRRPELAHPRLEHKVWMNA